MTNSDPAAIEPKIGLNEVFVPFVHVSSLRGPMPSGSLHCCALETTLERADLEGWK
jgi:hypothetical protein